jgi:hypothetical protein
MLSGPGAVLSSRASFQGVGVPIGMPPCWASLEIHSWSLPELAQPPRTLPTTSTTPDTSQLTPSR